MSIVFTIGGDQCPMRGSEATERGEGVGGGYDIFHYFCLYFRYFIFYINMSTIFSGNIHTYGNSCESLLSNETLHAWVSRSHICDIDRNPGLTGIGIYSVCYQQNWESWKGFKIIILMVWWLFMKIRPSFHDLTERVKICNFSILSFTHICTLFT